MTLEFVFMGATIVVQEPLPGGPKLVAAGSPRAVCETIKERLKAELASHGHDVAEMIEQGD